MKRHVTINSKYPFNGDPNCNQLQFPSNAPIAINSKQHPQNGWLIGSYEGQKGWFPASYVDYRPPPPKSAPPLPPVYETSEFGGDEERSPRSVTNTISINGVSSYGNSHRSVPACGFPLASPDSSSVSGFTDQSSKRRSSPRPIKNPALTAVHKRTDDALDANSNTVRTEIRPSTNSNQDYNINSSTSSDFNTNNVLGGNYLSTARPNENPLPDPTTQGKFEGGDEWLNANGNENEKRGAKPWPSTGNVLEKIKKWNRPKMNSLKRVQPLMFQHTPAAKQPEWNAEPQIEVDGQRVTQALYDGRFDLSSGNQEQQQQ